MKDNKLLGYIIQLTNTIQDSMEDWNEEDVEEGFKEKGNSLFESLQNMLSNFEKKEL